MSGKKETPEAVTEKKQTITEKKPHTLSIGKWLNAKKPLEELADNPEMDIKKAYWIGKAVDKIESIENNIGRQNRKILQKYTKGDEKMNQQHPKWNQFLDETDKLTDEEETIELPMIFISDLEGVNVKFSKLAWLIEEPS